MAHSDQAADHLAEQRASEAANQPDRPALLVGSVPLGDTEAVMTTVAETLGTRVARIPDGETGERFHWIAFQRDRLAANPALKAIEDWGAAPQFALKDSHEGPVTFSPLGYAEAAMASWTTFQKLVAEGKIAPTQRFQVSLPTPLAVVGLYLDPGSQEQVLTGYAERLFAELKEICEIVPHDKLAIQWDVAVEIMVLEGIRPTYLGDRAFEGIIDQLSGCIGRVPAGVEVGLHLCYGDSGGKHFKEPDDTALLVKVANAVLAAAPRPVAWVHMPVPIARDDIAYFAPLEGLRLPEGTELFLGLVHHGDGEEGCRRRIAAAETVIKDFGVATECGIGRRPPETVVPLLELHKTLAH